MAPLVLFSELATVGIWSICAGFGRFPRFLVFSIPANRRGNCAALTPGAALRSCDAWCPQRDTFPHHPNSPLQHPHCWLSALLSSEHPVAGNYLLFFFYYLFSPPDPPLTRGAHSVHRSVPNSELSARHCIGTQ